MPLNSSNNSLLSLVYSSNHWVDDLLHPDTHLRCIHAALSVHNHVFHALLKVLQKLGVSDSRHVLLREQLAIFLHGSVKGLSVTDILQILSPSKCGQYCISSHICADQKRTCITGISDVFYLSDLFYSHYCNISTLGSWVLTVTYCSFLIRCSSHVTMDCKLSCQKCDITPVFEAASWDVRTAPKWPKKCKKKNVKNNSNYVVA
jgi:hypothetical protein